MNLDHLRWIIAGCGLILIAGIYLRWHFGRKCADDSDPAFQTDEKPSADDCSLRAGAAELNEDFELPSMRNARSDLLFDDPDPANDTAEFESVDPAKRNDTASEDALCIVQIKVTAHDGMCFSGALLIEALGAVGLEFGSMNIFHMQRNGGSMPLFSVVNLVEPGTFPIDDPSHFESPGVVFFLQLAACDRPLVAFDEMIRIVHILAARIGGEVRDQANELLTVEKTEAIRKSFSHAMEMPA